MLLGGIDVFHLVADGEMRAAGLPGNHCAFVLELDGRLSVDALSMLLQRAIDRLPELSWRLESPLLGRPRWRPAEVRAHERLEVHEGERAAPLEWAERLLDRRLDGARPWALDLVRRDAGDLVVFRWFHPLTDARGAERLVRWLGSEDASPPAERFRTSDAALTGLDRDARVALARAYTAHVMRIGRTPAVSPWGSRPREARAGRTHAVRVVLGREETAAFDARVRSVARLAETSLMVRAATLLCDDVLRARGLAPVRYVVPVPLSLDPKAGTERMLGNHLTMMLLELERADLEDEARAALRMAEQQRAIVRDKLDRGMLAGLDLVKWLPGPVYRFVRDRPFSDETSSLVVSNPGALTIERFAGIAVKDAFFVPLVTAPPGLQVVFSRFRGELSALVVHVEGACSRAEIERATGRLRAALRGRAPL